MPENLTGFDRENYSPEQICESKLRLLRLFIDLAGKERMDKEEVIEYIDLAISNQHITGEDAQVLKRDLDEVLGHTPEQIRESKLRLLRLFIDLAGKERMDKEEVIEYIDLAISNQHITGEDAQVLKRELDEKVG